MEPETCEPCAEGTIGEIWLQGPSVVAGYWQRPIETAETFAALLSGIDAGPFLRTGDLGCLIEGQLVVTGRLKDVVIVAGRNHYPQDLEWSSESAHPSLRVGGAAAFGVSSPLGLDGEELVIVQEVALRSSDTGAAIQAIRRAIAADHGLEPVAVILLPAGQLPRTSSGKVRRRACREAYLAGTLPALASWPESASQAENAEATAHSLDPVEPK